MSCGDSVGAQCCSSGNLQWCDPSMPGLACESGTCACKYPDLPCGSGSVCQPDSPSANFKGECAPKDFNTCSRGQYVCLENPKAGCGPDYDFFNGKHGCSGDFCLVPLATYTGDCTSKTQCAAGQYACTAGNNSCGTSPDLIGKDPKCTSFCHVPG